MSGGKEGYRAGRRDACSHPRPEWNEYEDIRSPSSLGTCSPTPSLPNLQCRAMPGVFGGATIAPWDVISARLYGLERLLGKGDVRDLLRSFPALSWLAPTPQVSLGAELPVGCSCAHQLPCIPYPCKHRWLASMPLMWAVPCSLHGLLQIFVWGRATTNNHACVHPQAFGTRPLVTNTATGASYTAGCMGRLLRDAGAEQVSSSGKDRLGVRGPRCCRTCPRMITSGGLRVQRSGAELADTCLSCGAVIPLLGPL